MQYILSQQEHDDLVKAGEAKWKARFEEFMATLKKEIKMRGGPMNPLTFSNFSQHDDGLLECLRLAIRKFEAGTKVTE